jgi:transposase
MEGPLLMSSKERRRKSIFGDVEAGRISVRQASELLGLCYRQCKRSYKRYREAGDAGLVHRSRGRSSNRRSPAEFRERVLRRYEEKYQGYGATLAAEKLAEEGFEVDHETLRRWLLSKGLLKRRRKRSEYRSRRERRPRFGELVQMDGSHHRWFGPAGEQCCLINMVDDATGVTLGFMAEEETTRACMMQLWQWIDNFGVPQALYTDKKTVFVTDREPTLEEQLAGITPKTAFGKACEKLGIEIIEANSPQAKGRVERNHAVYQDRFVKELALRGATTLAEANEILATGFVDGLNAKFARPPASDENAHLQVPKGLDLADVFCFEDTRRIQNDWVVRHENSHYQIEGDNTPLPRPKAQVTVRTHLDGRVQILYKGKALRYTRLSPEDLASQRGKDKKQRPPAAQKIVDFKSKKASRTPWKQNVALMFADTKMGPDK